MNHKYFLPCQYIVHFCHWSLFSRGPTSCHHSHLSDKTAWLQRPFLPSSLKRTNVPTVHFMQSFFQGWSSAVPIRTPINMDHRIRQCLPVTLDFLSRDIYPIISAPLLLHIWLYLLHRVWVFLSEHTLPVCPRTVACPDVWRHQLSRQHEEISNYHGLLTETITYQYSIRWQE